MTRLIRTLALFLFVTTSLFAQKQEAKIYDPAADAAADLRKAIATAGAEHKHVFLQVGGNWCPWCIKFDKLIAADARIDSILKADYIFLRINYSKENMNLPVLAQLGYPQRFGFPVFVILDQKGNRLHTQDSGLLEKGDHHDPALVLSVLRNWSPKALDPGKYKKN